MGKQTSNTQKSKVGRNDLCPCDSGLKYKKCCLARFELSSSSGRVTSKIFDRDLSFQDRGIAKSADLYNDIAVDLFAKGDIDGALASYKRALEADPTHVHAFNNLGTLHSSRGDLEAAVACFERALKIDGSYADAYHNLGHALKGAGQVEEAANAFRSASELDPTNETAKFMFASLTGAEVDIVPEDYVRELFDYYATYEPYDKVMLEKLDYSLPKRLFQDFSAKVWNGTDKPSFAVATDLGCGTGLVGQEFRPACKKMVGVDLSSEMLKIAEKKGIYDRLAHSSIAEFFGDPQAEKSDLFLATEVLLYIADLAEFFEGVRAKANPSAHLVISTEVSLDKDVELRQTGRIAHSDRYVKTQASRFGWDVQGFQNVELREHKGSRISGGVYFLKLCDR